MSNEIKARYSADISQVEIANDKLSAQNEKLSRQVANMTAKASGFNKTYGNSWNAVRARVEEYSRAVKSATNLKDWYGAIEKLQKAQREFAEVNAHFNSATAEPSVDGVVTAKLSYDSLREAIIRTKAARDAAELKSPEFAKAAANLAKLETAYRKLTTSTEDATKKSKKQQVQLRAEGNSIEGLAKQIEYLEEKQGKMGAGEKFDRLSGIIARLRLRMKGLQDDAAKAGEAMSKCATAPAGSYTRLDYELKRAKEDLKGLTAGTREFVAQQMKVARIQEHWEKLDKTINKTAKSQKVSSGIAGTMIGQAKSLFATYVGMHQILQEISAEWEKHRAFQLDASKKQVGVEGALVAQAANIGAENLPAVKKWARDNQMDLLGKQEDIVNLVGAAISSGAEDLKTAIKVTASAMKMNPGNPQLASELLQGGIMVGRLNKTRDYDAAFGQLRSSSKASQAVDESQFIGNILGKLAALTRGRKNMDGLSTERALEYLTFSSRIHGDREGSTSSTNMAAIFQRMDEFNPVLKKTLKDGTVAKLDQATIDKFKDTRSFDKRMEMVRSNKDLANQWIDKQRTGGPKEFAFAMSILKNDKAAARMMKESESAVLPIKEAGAYFRKEVEATAKAVPNLIAAKQNEVGKEFAATEDKTALLATARATWDSIWNTSADGTPPVNLTGWDTGKRMLSAVDRQSFANGRSVGSVKGGNEVTDMIMWVRRLIEDEQKAGNKVAEQSLEAQLKSLEKIASVLEEMERKQNGGQRPAQAPQAPPVIRRPAVFR